MTTGGKDNQLHLGFLTAVDDSNRGYIGGLLVTNRFGRPLEFQCTTPVKPNRTQEILYGPTLVPFVLGELIGKTLVTKVSVKPRLILTDRSEILELRNQISIPVASLVEPAPESPLNVVRLGRQNFEVHSEHSTDIEAVNKFVSLIARDADMQEPIDRVRDALKETMGAAA